MSPDTASHPARILIVDDERHNRELLEVMLTPEGHLLLTAASGEEALAMVAQQPPDLILLDIMMPGMDGYQVAAQIKGSPATRNIPVIMVTAQDDRHARMLGLSAGAEDFLGKPVDRAELCVRVRNLLRLKEYSDYHDKYSQMLEEAVGSRTVELVESERLYRSTFDAAPVGIVHVGLDGRWLRVNPRLCDLLGYSREELQSGAAAELLQSEEAAGEADSFRQMAAGTLGRHVVDEKRYRRRDGSAMWARVNTSVHRNTEGQAQYFICAMEDFTERKRMEAQRELVAALVEASPDFIGFADPKTTQIQYINKYGRRMCGIGEDEDIGKLKISDVHPSWMNERMAEVILPAAVRDGSWEGEGAFLHRNGHEIPVSMALVARKAANGEVETFYTVSRDISERKRTELALRHSFDLLDQTGRLAKVGGWELDVETRTLTWTEEVYRIHEVDPATQPSVAEALQFYAPEARPIITAAVKAAIDTGTPFDLELPLVIGEGRRWLHVQGVAERRGGKTIRLSGAAQDITERKAADESRRLRSAALQAAADAVVITDVAGSIEWVNPAFTQITGYTFEEALGKHHRDLVKSDKQAPASYRDLWATVLAGRTWRGELINHRKDGSLYTEHQVVTPILNAAGAITHFVAIQQDMTERLQLEAQYRQAQKMETVGQLASGIAHDFNNLLTIINGTAELVMKQTSQDSPVYTDVREILRSGERAAALTRQLLAFSRQQILEPRVMSLNTAVAGMESLLRRLLGEDIDLVIVLAPDLTNTRVDAGQIEQVISNLAVNARDAMPNGGHLTIETQNVTIDETSARQHEMVAPPGPYVLLTVSDSGVGMNEVTRARVFEPFFTTKDPGKGTGLGLSTVYGIVKQSQGFVWVYSEVGHGTTFKVYLPQVADAADTERPVPTVVRSSGTETVLLVEDNAGIRRLAVRLLEPAGYTVFGASTAEEALRLLERHEGPVHLLLSDVVLPGMSGRQLAERLVQTHPTTKVLFMSGYTSDAIVRHGLLETQVAFLDKPFTAETFLQKVRTVLDSEARALSAT